MATRQRGTLDFPKRNRPSLPAIPVPAKRVATADADWGADSKPSFGSNARAPPTVEEDDLTALEDDQREDIYTEKEIRLNLFGNSIEEFEDKEEPEEEPEEEQASTPALPTTPLRDLSPDIEPEPDPFFDNSPVFEKACDESQITPDLVTLAVGMFATSLDLSTSQYSAMVELLVFLSKCPEAISKIPKTLNTLKKRLRNMLPIMTIKGYTFEPDNEDLPPQSKDPATAYYFDLKEYASKWLSDPAVSKHLHTGFGEIVDVNHELWHGNAWMESILTTSGQFAKLDNGTPLIPSDCVYYSYPDDPPGHPPYLGRINGIALDKREVQGQGLGQAGVLSALISPLLLPNMLPHDLRVKYNTARPTVLDNDTCKHHNTDSPLLRGLSELILVEDSDSEDIIPISHIRKHEYIFMLDYKDFNTAAELFPTGQRPRYYVAAIAYGFTSSLGSGTGIKSVANRHRLTAEAELITYGRNNILQADDFISIPYTIFIDSFGLWRNSYHSLAGMYITPAGLPFDLRQKLDNVNVWMLGPFGSSESDMALAIGKDSRRMANGAKVGLIGGKDISVTVRMVCLAYNGDMPQQNKLACAKSHTAIYGCRSCKVETKSFDKLDIDVEKIGRYKVPVEELLRQGNLIKLKNKRDEFFKNHGLPDGMEASPLQDVHPTFDFHKGTPRDVLHSEFRVSKHSQHVLTQGVFGVPGLAAYRLAWEAMEMPYRWGRPQNPVSHKGSMNFSENGRVACLNPFVLIRTFNTNKRLLKPTVEKLYQARCSTPAATTTPRDVYDHIINSFYKIALSNFFTMKKQLTSQEQAELPEIVIESRRAYQWLCHGVQEQKELKEKHKIPNVHVPLHFKQDLKNYATLRNSSCFAGESKHKIFKLHAPHTNSKENDFQLLQAINISQATRSVVHGMYRDSPTEAFGILTEQVEQILQDCPRMRQCIVGADSEVKLKQLDGDKRAIVDHTGSVFCHARVGKNMATRTGSKHNDLEELSKVYQRLYGTDLSTVRKTYVRYWGSITGTIPQTNSRLGPTPMEKRKFRVNEIIKALDGFKIINRILTVSIGDLSRAFIEVIPLTRNEREELWVAPYEVYTKYPEGNMVASPLFIPLSEVLPERLHFVMKLEDRSWWYNNLVLDTH